MGAFADLAGFIVGGDGKGNDLALHSDDLRFGPDLHADGCGSQVGNIQLNANAGAAIRNAGFDGLAGGAFHHGHHAGGGVDQQAAGADLSGGVFLFDQGGCFTLHANSNLHRNNLLMFCFNIADGRKYVKKGD